MDDYTIGWRTREHQADLRREASYVPLIAGARLTEAKPVQAAAAPDRPEVPDRDRALWRRVLAHLVPSPLARHGHRS